MMTLDPGRGVNQQCEAGSVRFGKAVFAKSLDLLGDTLGKFGRQAVFPHAGPQLVLIFLQIPLASPGSHRPPQLVSLARREIGGDDGELHDLFLKDGHAICPCQNGIHLVGNALDGFPSLPPLQVGMHHLALDRTRPNQGDLDHQIVVLARPQARQHGHLGARLNLKNAHAVGVAQHLVGRRVFRRNVVETPWPAMALAQQVEHATQGRQHAEGQDIDLHQANRVQIVLVPLDHRAFRHGGVLDRHQPGQRTARHDETADMLGQMTGKTAQLLGNPQPFLDARRSRVEPLFGEAGRQLLPFIPPGQRCGQSVDACHVETQHPAGVTQGALGAIGDQRRRQRRAFATVFAVDVGDDLVAPLMLEIDVDIRRFAALLRDEAFEQHAGPLGIDGGDAQREADR